MPYTPTTYVDGTTPAIDAANLNHAETGIQSATTTAEAAIPKPNAPSANQVLYYNGTAWAAEQIVNALISASAAIDWTKINTTGQITNADVSAGAALAISKLANYPNDATKFLSGAGTWIAAAPTTYRKTTAKTVNNTVTETDLLNGEITIAANPGTTSKIRLTASGDLLNNTGGSVVTPRLKLKLGATTIIDTGATVSSSWGTNASRFGWGIEATITNLGAANSQWTNFRGALGFLGAAAGGAAFTTGEGNITAAGNVVVRLDGGNASAVDTTAQQALVLSVILPTASASCEMKLYEAVVEVV